MPAKKTAAPEKKFESTRPAAFVADPKDPQKAVQVGPQEVDMKGYTGKYHKIGEPKDAPDYGLMVVDEDEAAKHYGHTHHAKSEEHFWTGTEKQFKEQFEK